jgi:uncharacterized cupredoxin-like copper-binding protein
MEGIMRSSVRAAVLAVLMIVPGAARAQAPAVQEVVLANFSFSPASLHLAAGKPVRLHFVNRGSGGHNFAAPEFFAAARIDPASRTAVRGGKIELKKGQSADVLLTPAKGHYDARCTHFLHTGFGMKGEISVE